MKEKILSYIGKFGSPALAFAGITISFFKNFGNYAALPTFVANFLLSSKIIDLPEIEFKTRLKKIAPKDINHDIIRISKSAVKLAFKASIDDFTTDKDIQKKIKNKIDDIYTQLEENGIWDDITYKDIIDHENDLSDSFSKWCEIFTEELSTQ